MASLAKFASIFLLLVLTSSLVTCSDDANMESLMTMVQQQAATIQQQSATIQSLQARMSSVEQQSGTITELSTKLSGLSNQLDTNARVYFTAHMTAVAPNIGTSNSPIKFDTVPENVGNGYNPLTGVFTAPVSGVYIFYSQLMKQGNVNYIHYAIDKAGTVVCMNSMDANNEYDKSSCLATTHVQKGETVFVRRNDGDVTLEGHWWCAFSGVLITADA